MSSEQPPQNPYLTYLLKGEPPPPKIRSREQNNQAANALAAVNQALREQRAELEDGVVKILRRRLNGIEGMVDHFNRSKISISSRSSKK